MTTSSNYHPNTTANQPTNVESTIIIYCVILGMLTPIAIIGNSLVLAAIFRTPSLRLPPTAFLCTLALSDLVVGFIVQPLYIASEFTTVSFMQPLVELASYIGCGVSLWTMTETQRGSVYGSSLSHEISHISDYISRHVHIIDNFLHYLAPLCNLLFKSDDIFTFYGHHDFLFATNFNGFLHRHLSNCSSPSS